MFTEKTRSNAHARRPWLGQPIKEAAWPLELVDLLRDPVWVGTNLLPADGSPVLLVPGFLSGDASFAFMRAWLRRLGYRTYGADIRWNVDCADHAARRLEHRLREVAESTGHPVHIVAHSRGGLFARALLKRRPEAIKQVITLGSPLGGEFECSLPVATAVACARAAQWLRRPDNRRKGCYTSNCLCGYSSELSAALPPGVPLTSIYTIDDGIVRPTACVVPEASCIGVRGSHLGLVYNAEVYRHIARLLQVPETEGERWRS